jgi:hypothetical protein
MSKKLRLATGLSISILLIAYMFLLAYLFSRYDISYFIVAPFFIVLSLGAGILLYYILSGFKTKIRQIIIILAVFLSAMLIMTLLHPSNPRVFTNLRRYITVYGDYPQNIVREDMASYEDARMAAAMAKFADDLPDEILRIELLDYNNSAYPGQKIETYYIEKKGDVLTYDKTKMQVLTDAENITIIFNPDGVDSSLQWSGKSSAIFMPYTGGLEPIGNNFAIDYSTNKIELETGAMKLFYRLLSNK